MTQDPKRWNCAWDRVRIKDAGLRSTCWKFAIHVLNSSGKGEGEGEGEGEGIWWEVSADDGVAVECFSVYSLVI
jgi:hypothetical protein